MKFIICLYMLLINISLLMGQTNPDEVINAHYNHILEERWQELAKLYHDDDLKKFRKFFTKAMEADTQFREGITDSIYTFEKLKLISPSEFYSVYIDKIYSKIFSADIKIDRFSIVGKIDEDSLNLQYIVEIVVSKDTLELKNKEIIHLQKCADNYKIRFNDEMNILLDHVKIKYNDSKGNALDKKELKNTLVLIDYPDAKNYQDAWSDKTELSLFDLETNEHTRLTNDFSDDQSITLHPDMKYVFFVSNRPQKNGWGDDHIHKYNLSTGQIEKYDIELHDRFAELNHYLFDHPCWSSTGLFAFTGEDREDLNSEEKLLYLSNSELIVLDSCKNFFSSVSWSNNGKLLYYEKSDKDFNTENIIYNFASTKKLKVQQDTSKHLNYKVWHPDNKRIIFQAYHDDGQLELLSYDIISDKIDDFYSNPEIKGDLICFGKTEDEIFVFEKDECNSEFNLISIDLMKKAINKLNKKPIYISEGIYIR